MQVWEERTIHFFHWQSPWPWESGIGSCFDQSFTEVHLSWFLDAYLETVGVGAPKGHSAHLSIFLGEPLATGTHESKLRLSTQKQKATFERMALKQARVIKRLVIVNSYFKRSASAQDECSRRVRGGRVSLLLLLFLWGNTAHEAFCPPAWKGAEEDEVWMLSAQECLCCDQMLLHSRAVNYDGGLELILGGLAVTY